MNSKVCMVGSNLRMNDLLVSFHRYARVRAKCVGKTCFRLWASLQYPRVVIGVREVGVLQMVLEQPYDPG